MPKKADAEEADARVVVDGRKVNEGFHADAEKADAKNEVEADAEKADAKEDFYANEGRC